MSTLGVNLLSPARLARLHRRALVRWWSAGMGVYLAGAVGVAITMSVGAMSQDVSDELASATRRLDNRKEHAGRLATELGERRKELEAAQAVGDHPDWGLLLSALAQRRGEAIALTSVELRRVQKAAPVREQASSRRAMRSAPAPQRTVIELVVRGIGTDLASVNDFVLELEEFGVFDAVRLEDTSVRAGAAGLADANEFEVRCELTDEATGAAP
jgi:hypothetical protein